jgi:murein DD-endopeptidase MepM/ murein hydrolase activator NlpD
VILKSYSLLCAILLLAACSSFKGPGDYKTGADYPSTDTNPAPAAPPATDAATPSEESSPQAATFRLHWPVSDIRITQNFEPSKNPRHKGVDLGGRRGTPIYAAHDGHVVYTGRDFHGYGNMILLEYNNEWATLYAHLRKIQVREGEYIHAGTTIGTMGRTGRATGVHLHFELMHKKLPIDPLIYLQTGQQITYHPTNMFSTLGCRASATGG